MTPPFQDLFWGRHTIGPPADSGSLTLTLDGPYHLISFGLSTEAAADWSMDHLGRGDAGSAQSSSSVSIEIVPR